MVAGYGYRVNRLLMGISIRMRNCAEKDNARLGRKQSRNGAQPWMKQTRKDGPPEILSETKAVPPARSMLRNGQVTFENDGSASRLRLYPRLPRFPGFLPS
jgi:hypothetical protein